MLCMSMPTKPSPKAKPKKAKPRPSTKTKAEPKRLDKIARGGSSAVLVGNVAKLDIPSHWTWSDVRPLACQLLYSKQLGVYQDDRGRTRDDSAKDLEISVSFYNKIRSGRALWPFYIVATSLELSMTKSREPREVTSAVPANSYTTYDLDEAHNAFDDALAAWRARSGAKPKTFIVDPPQDRPNVPGRGFELGSARQWHVSDHAPVSRTTDDASMQISVGSEREWNSDDQAAYKALMAAVKPVLRNYIKDIRRSSPLWTPEERETSVKPDVSIYMHRETGDEWRPNESHLSITIDSGWTHVDGWLDQQWPIHVLGYDWAVLDGALVVQLLRLNDYPRPIRVRALRHYIEDDDLHCLTTETADVEWVRGVPRLHWDPQESLPRGWVPFNPSS
jgi:hypothetical protein